MNQTPTFKRRIRLIQPSLQLRLIGAFAGLTALALLIQGLVLADFLTRLAGEMGSAGAQLATSMPGLLARSLAVCAVLVIPGLILIGVRITFRIAGPLYRMEKHLEAIARGERPGTCKIREDDQLQGFCDTLNRALEVALAAAPDAASEGTNAAQPEGNRSTKLAA